MDAANTRSGPAPSPTAAETESLSLAKVLLQVTQGEEGVSRRLDEARQAYRQGTSDPAAPLEQQRQRLLIELSNLQTEVMLTVSDNALLLRMLLLIVEQMTDTYWAETEQDLKFVELGMGRVRGALAQVRRVERNRILARSLAVVISLLAVVGIALLIWWGSRPGGPSVDYVLPIIQVPLPVLVWSMIGSFTAILYRFNKSGDADLQDPMRWLFSRPLTGIMMGTVSYFILKVGFLSLSIDQSVNLGSLEVMWLVAFITGFSDRLADSALKLMAGRFGYSGDQAELVSLDRAPSTLPAPSAQGIQSLAEKLPILGRRQHRQPGAAPGASPKVDGDGPSPGPN